MREMRETTCIRKLSKGNFEPDGEQHEEDLRKAALVEAREAFRCGRRGMHGFASLPVISPLGRLVAI
jgi:hypothetical protein